MVDFFDKIYFSIKDKNAILKKVRFYSVCRFLTRFLANNILPVYFKLTANNKAYRLDRDHSRNNTIVSLTTFPARINNVWMVLECMLRQQTKPDKIILWLSKEQFPSLEILPENLLKLQKRGVQIEIRDEDLRSHKKYYYTIKEYPDYNFITVDDDIIYPSHTISVLLKANKQYPASVICRLTIRILYDENNNPLSFSEWGHSDYGKKGGVLFFGSGGGTFFPKGSLYKDVDNYSLFMDLCKYADDVWLNAMCRLNKTNLVSITDNYSILPIMIKDNNTLHSINIDLNDKQVANVIHYYVKSQNTNPFDSEADFIKSDIFNYQVKIS